MSKSAHTYFEYCEIDNNYGISAAVDFSCRYMVPAIGFCCQVQNAKEAGQL